MEQSDGKWLETVRKKTESIIDEVPAGAWEEIRSAAGRAAGRRRGRKVALGAAALCAAAALAAVLVLPHHSQDIPSSAVAVVPAPATSEASAAEPDVTGASIPYRISTNTFADVVGTETGNSVIQIAEDAVTVDKPDVSDIPEPAEPSDPTESNTVSKHTSGVAPASGPKSITIEEYLAANDERPARRPKLRVAVSGNEGALNRSRAAGTNTLYRWCSVQPDGLPNPVNYDYDDYPGNDNNAAFQQWLSEHYGITSEQNQFLQHYSYRHFAPISAKLALSLDISDRWDIETGAVYTVLNSEVTAKYASEAAVRQRLQFIGVPLAVRYEAFRSGRSSLYGTAGGQVDKCIKASGVLPDQTYDRLFWSSTAQLGYQYSILPELGIFLEAGAAYHFDNGASVCTIYSDHPLQASLQAGIRLGK